ncbi:acetyltransferase [Marinigracilibium pacificum]|uniref:Acetyltransferase n=1 Tax=Marinigracilibium pacificum TaxID=2729599 RepID=A0A848IU60_9BACT|nr:acetyltransferase [Marinigracilibium pacificum]NMM48033.1 acetyltransferase [Marinigracilibium pacificum]
MSELVIIGAGGLGKEVLSLVQNINQVVKTWDILGFYDDGLKKGAEVAGHHVLGGIDELNITEQKLAVVLAIGDPLIKSRIFDKLKGQPYLFFPKLIHPKAFISNINSVKVGEGTIISSGVQITTDVMIGEFVLINLNTTIGHDVRIGHFCSVMPGVNIAGNIIIEEKCLIGSGANLINGCHIHENVKVGSGAVVIDDVQADKTVVGIPAKEI